MFKFCIKCGPFTRLAEAHTMQLVASRTSIPVPKIYCAFERAGQTRHVIPPDGVGVASTSGGPIYDCRLPTRSFWGPFATVYDFYTELRNGIDMRVCSEAGDTLPSDLADLLAFHKEAHPVVLTHGDLSSLNILAQGDEVVGIIDWETAGWLPYYWEYVSAWHANPQNYFWQQEVDRFLNPMPSKRCFSFLSST